MSAHEHDPMPRNVMFVTCVSIFCATLAYVAYLVTKSNGPSPCVESSYNPEKIYSLTCPDPRQTLSTPPGWTWIKCACPEASKQ